MTIQTRRDKEKVEMRQLILDVSKAIASEDGWQNLTIRKICQKISYTAPVIYQYFESKEAILLALQEEGFNQIKQQFELVDKQHKIASKRLFEYAMVWWNFTKANPELYQVMFSLQGVVCNQNGCQRLEEILEIYKLAFSSLNEGALKSKQTNLELCDNFIAIIHGYIDIKLIDKIKSKDRYNDQSYKNALMRFIDSIKN